MFAGIDVSKNWVDAALADGGACERASPLKAAKWLKRQGVTLVALEATGGYELPVIAALQREGVAVARVNPRQARQFAQAVGRRAKTDRGDAALLAHYAKAIRPEPVKLPAGELIALRSLCMRRRDLVLMRTAERNRLAQAADPWIKGSIQAMLTHLAAMIKQVEAAIAAHFAAHPQLEARRRRLCTLPGIGSVTSAMLVAYLPELGQASRTQIAALAGVAPYTRESGMWKGKSFCSGGRAPVRECLYMAALSNIRRHNRFADTYKHLTQKGKPPKVALVATMRKMLVTLNAMTQQQTDYRNDNP